jgi:peptidylprolyl isomerase
VKPHRSSRRAALVVATGLLLSPALAACGGSSSSSAAAPSGSSSAASSASSGVKATGGFGEKPTLTVPGGTAPAKLSAEVLTAGTGATVAKGQTLVVNYLGQTWEPKDGKPNIFDNSYDRKAPASFQIGAGRVIPGWDQTLVGQKIGSRVLLTIPPAQGYGDNPTSPLAKNTLIFVVDVLGSYDAGATANGSPAGALPAGFPKVASEPGKVPAVTSVTGVTPGKTTQSALLLTGGGDTLQTGKQLVLNLLQVDAKTGKTIGSSFTSGPQLVPAQQVLEVVPTLKNAKVGSRAVFIPPAPTKKGETPVVVVLDVLGQY